MLMIDLLANDCRDFQAVTGAQARTLSARG
jgi:hypothetical protein